jgi:hypothetical protein
MGHPLNIPTGFVALMICGLLGFPVFAPVFLIFSFTADYIPMWAITPILWAAAIAGLYVDYKILHWIFRKIKPKS